MSWDAGSLPDDRLEALVRSVLDEGIVEDVVGMTLTGWDLRDPDAALAQLVFDSADGGSVASGIRSGTSHARARTFDVEGAAFDFEEIGDRIVGQVVPAPVTLSLETTVGARRLELDEHGQFSAIVEPGLARLRAETAIAMMLTEWFVLGTGRERR